MLLLYVYSPLLAGMTSFWVLLYGLARGLAVARERGYRTTLLAEDARQQSGFLENLQGIITLKVYGLEADRGHRWLNEYGDYVNSSVRLERFQNRAMAWQNLILGMDHVVTVYLGIGLVLEQAMTVGQLMAYVFLRQHFVGAVSSLLPRLLELRLARAELERLADITGYPASPVVTSGGSPGSRGKPLVQVAGLGFAYPGQSRMVVQNLGFTLQRGETLGVWGPSGCGKSTLLHLLLGLLQPGQGEVQINGQPPGPGTNGQVAAVLHGDRLLSGTLLYNITLDRGPLDRPWLSRCCELACLQDDLQRLPAGLATRVAESGGMLSAGQRQRVLLARALYTRPRLLILDEALANLDAASATGIVTGIQQLGIALILVTHDPALLACATQRLALGHPGSAPSC